MIERGCQDAQYAKSGACSLAQLCMRERRSTASSIKAAVHSPGLHGMAAVWYAYDIERLD